MADYPILRHINISGLIGGAGGDPWKLDSTLQSGEPQEVAQLAKAFHDAGVCMSATSQEFASARSRFEASWNRESGTHPINDSAEVQRATTSLHLDHQQLARIGADLENIAASLAEAQRASHNTIQSLDSSLKQIDDAIERAIQQGAVLRDSDIAPLEDMAILDTQEALGQIEATRDAYSGELSRAIAEMKTEGYVADAVDPVDGDGHDEIADARSRATAYGENQRATDLALVDSPGPVTPEKEEAAARLRDFATINDSTASPEAVRLAGERLDDYEKVTQPGPWSPDPVLGIPPVRRALTRLEWQKQLEKGTPWMPPMTADEATRWMDRQEAEARLAAIDSTQRALEESGLSCGKAQTLVDALASGLTLKDLAQYAGVTGDAAKDVDGRVSVGRHALDGFNPETIKTIGSIGKVVKGAGSLLDFGLAIDAVRNGAPGGETVGGLVGSLGGGVAGGAALGFLGGLELGPGGAFVGTMVGGIAGGAFGDKLGGLAGKKLFDE